VCSASEYNALLHASLKAVVHKINTLVVSQLVQMCRQDWPIQKSLLMIITWQPNVEHCQKLDRSVWTCSYSRYPAILQDNKQSTGCEAQLARKCLFPSTLGGIFSCKVGHTDPVFGVPPGFISARKVTSLSVQRLCFLSPWLTQNLITTFWLRWHWNGVQSWSESAS